MVNEYIYQIYGLNVSCSFPWHQHKRSTRPADVTISIISRNSSDDVAPFLNKTNWNQEGINYRVSSNRYYWEFEGIGKFYIENGNCVIIAPDPEVDINSIKTILLGSIFGVLLYQRGQLPLIGSAILHNNRAFLLLGKSAAGKSTLAAALMQRGFSVLSDHLCSIGESASAQIGYPFLQLWQDATQMLQINTSQATPIRPGHNKLQLPIEQNLNSSSFVVGGIYLLTPSSQTQMYLQDLYGFNKFESVRDMRYLGHLCESPEGRFGRHNYLTQLVQSCSVKRLHFERTKKTINQVVEMLARDIKNKNLV
ncbi:MAG: hypothetical protein MI864_03045 [Pseudomonadales bacterium]|uniref:HPr serine kinase n=1 Tax=Oleiphilus messinensis TaxID=141451 RepID=A0A1Y0I4P3_9GAMM|nr:hypothetical protein [Oleiphilus messinensis]ARU54383.1 HPr serine kinase [Oleiphilus messinensis]MCG8609489.1 hypothetical protein [Pseudomonadales bacterium]